MESIKVPLNVKLQKRKRVRSTLKPISGMVRDTLMVQSISSYLTRITIKVDTAISMHLRMQARSFIEMSTHIFILRYNITIVNEVYHFEY